MSLKDILREESTVPALRYHLKKVNYVHPREHTPRSTGCAMRGQLCAVLLLLCGAVLTEEAIVDSESTIMYSLPT